MTMFESQRSLSSSYLNSSPQPSSSRSLSRIPKTPTSSGTSRKQRCSSTVYSPSRRRRSIAMQNRMSRSLRDLFSPENDDQSKFEGRNISLPTAKAHRPRYEIERRQRASTGCILSSSSASIAKIRRQNRITSHRKPHLQSSNRSLSVLDLVDDETESDDQNKFEGRNESLPATKAHHPRYEIERRQRASTGCILSSSSASIAKIRRQNRITSHRKPHLQSSNRSLLVLDLVDDDTSNSVAASAPASMLREMASSSDMTELDNYKIWTDDSEENILYVDLEGTIHQSLTSTPSHPKVKPQSSQSLSSRSRRRSRSRRAKNGRNCENSVTQESMVLNTSCSVDGANTTDHDSRYRKRLLQSPPFWHPEEDRLCPRMRKDDEFDRVVDALLSPRLIRSKASLAKSRIGRSSMCHQSLRGSKSASAHSRSVASCESLTEEAFMAPYHRNDLSDCEDKPKRTRSFTYADVDEAKVPSTIAVPKRRSLVRSTRSINTNNNKEQEIECTREGRPNKRSNVMQLRARSNFVLWRNRRLSHGNDNKDTTSAEHVEDSQSGIETLAEGSATSTVSSQRDSHGNENEDTISVEDVEDSQSQGTETLDGGSATSTVNSLRDSHGNGNEDTISVEDVEDSQSQGTETLDEGRATSTVNDANSNETDPSPPLESQNAISPTANGLLERTETLLESTIKKAAKCITNKAKFSRSSKHCSNDSEDDDSGDDEENLSEQPSDFLQLEIPFPPPSHSDLLGSGSQDAATLVSPSSVPVIRRTSETISPVFIGDLSPTESLDPDTPKKSTKKSKRFRRLLTKSPGILRSLLPPLSQAYNHNQLD